MLDNKKSKTKTKTKKKKEERKKQKTRAAKIALQSRRPRLVCMHTNFDDGTEEYVKNEGKRLKEDQLVEGNVLVLVSSPRPAYMYTSLVDEIQLMHKDRKDYHMFSQMC